MPTAEEIQKQYYANTSGEYDAMHLSTGNDAEHDFSLSYLSSLIEYYGINSILDVGAGTGRTMLYLTNKFPHLRVMGIEPVKELRDIGYKKGIKTEALLDGDGTDLKFSNSSFDLVCAFAVLHHVKKPSSIIREMARISSKGIFISDSNNFGQGSFLSRSIKQALNAVHLWKVFNWVVTRGRGYKISKGDGLYYSYSVFNDYNLIKTHFRNIHILNTDHTKGINLYRHASHIAVFASGKK